LQVKDFMITAKRDYITLAHLCERQLGGPTWIWYGLYNWQRTTMVKAGVGEDLLSWSIKQGYSPKGTKQPWHTQTFKGTRLGLTVQAKAGV
jgi:hypothetical protein